MDSGIGGISYKILSRRLPVIATSSTSIRTVRSESSISIGLTMTGMATTGSSRFATIMISPLPF